MLNLLNKTIYTFIFVEKNTKYEKINCFYYPVCCNRIFLRTNSKSTSNTQLSRCCCRICRCLFKRRFINSRFWIQNCFSIYWCSSRSRDCFISCTSWQYKCRRCYLFCWGNTYFRRNICSSRRWNCKCIWI